MRTIVQEVSDISTRLPRVLLSPRPFSTTIADTARGHATSHSQVKQGRSDNAHTRRDSDRDEFKCGLCREEVRLATERGWL